MMQRLVVVGLSFGLLAAIGPNVTAAQAKGTVISEYAIPTANSLSGTIVAGPDGNLWFTESGASKIGRITTFGEITEFPLPPPNSQPIGIAPGTDGNLWFTEAAGNKIGRITPTGTITEFVVPTPASTPFIITG